MHSTGLGTKLVPVRLQSGNVATLYEVQPLHRQYGKEIAIANESKAVNSPEPFPSTTTAHQFAGLDLLSTAILIVDKDRRIMHANTAAENLFAFSRKNAKGTLLTRVLTDADRDVHDVLEHVFSEQTGFSGSSISVALPNRTVLQCSMVATPTESGNVVLEFQALDQQLRIAREERLLEQQKRNRELLRNLAHEIKNPLGGIRGAAQLLGQELENEALTEYTQVIVSEADRLQKLLDRLLTPHRLPKIERINVHEILEYVRNVLQLEFSEQLLIQRDYDISLPDIEADREQLVQAFLNVMRNAAQAIGGIGEVAIQTRIARQVTIARERHKLALEIRICDKGPGVPDHLRESLFNPLVSGREGGIGVGLSIAQNFINQHGGVIEFESAPGDTKFLITLPVRNRQAG